MELTDAVKLLGKPDGIQGGNLSEILEVAIADIVACREAGVIIDMNVYAVDADDGCRVCLAGAAMVCERPREVLAEKGSYFDEKNSWWDVVVDSLDLI